MNQINIMNIFIYMRSMKELGKKWKGLDGNEKARSGSKIDDSHNLVTRCNPEHVWCVACDFTEHGKKDMEEIRYGSLIRCKMCLNDRKLVL